MPARFGVHLFVALGMALAACPGPAQALWDERLRLYAALAGFRDDNVLRQPEAAAPVADRYRVTTLGLDLDAPLGQQRLVGALSVNRTRFDTFRQLDLDGHEARAAWHWRSSDAAEGRLGFAQRRALGSLASVQAGVPGTVPNAITTRRAYADSELHLTPRWRLQVEAARLEQDNDAAERRANDLVLDRGTAGLAYVSRAGNRLGVRARVGRGELANAQLVSGAFVDNSYREAELGLLATWHTGAKSKLEASAGRVARDYRQLPQRDFDGGVYALAFDWAPTGKLELGLSAARGISAAEEIQVNFVEAERVGLRLRYRASARTDLSALVETSDRRYRGDAAEVLGAAPERAERLNVATLSASYAPAAWITLGLSLRSEKRAPQAGVSAYEANIFGLEARLAF